jgi:glutathione S-transferase
MAMELYDLAGADDTIRFSPYCWRARMALAHKGLDTKTIPVRFGEKAKLGFSGQKLVPVLRDGQTIVCDSWDIGLYLDATYPDRPLLMDGPHALALTSFFRNWAQMRIGPAIMRIVLMDIHNACTAEDQTYFRSSREARLGIPLEQFILTEEEGCKSIAAELAPLRETLANQPFVNGDVSWCTDTSEVTY